MNLKVKVNIKIYSRMGTVIANRIARTIPIFSQSTVTRVWRLPLHTNKKGDFEEAFEYHIKSALTQWNCYVRCTSTDDYETDRHGLSLDCMLTDLTGWSNEHGHERTEDKVETIPVQARVSPSLSTAGSQPVEPRINHRSTKQILFCNFHIYIKRKVDLV
jgi:hypothetical protein